MRKYKSPSQEEVKGFVDAADAVGPELAYFISEAFLHKRLQISDDDSEVFFADEDQDPRVAHTLRKLNGKSGNLYASFEHATDERGRSGVAISQSILTHILEGLEKLLRAFLGKSDGTAAAGSSPAPGRSRRARHEQNSSFDF